MNPRIQWHEEAAASRDARFSGYGNRKAAVWRAELEAYLSSGHGDLGDIKARRWEDCRCGRVFQPGERGYLQCYTCSQASYAEGSTACAICQRRHSMAFPCCKSCQTAGREDMASLLRSVVLRRDGFACNACGEFEGQLDVHHINPDGSAWAWNCEVLCTGCWLTFGKQYGPLDELVWLDRATAYSTYLAEYLTDDEKDELQYQLRATLGGDFVGKPPRHPYGVDKVDEIEGLMNCLQKFGGAANGVLVTHQ